MLVLRLILLSLLQLLLQVRYGGAVEGAVGDAAVLEGATVETWAVVIVALTDNLAATNDDAAMAVVERGLGGLLKAKSEVLVRVEEG